MKKNDWILLITVSLYSYLFYLQNAGINFAIFTIALLIALIVRDKTLLKKTSWLVAAAGCIVSAGCIAYYGSTAAVIANIISLSMLSALSVAGESSVIFSLLFSFYSYSSSLLFMFFDRIDRKINSEEKTSTSTKKIVLIIIPVLITLVFFFMYRSSNILFKDLASKINLDFIFWKWIGFTLGGFILLYGFFYHRKITAIAYFDESASNQIPSSKTDTITLFGKKLHISEEDFSGKVLFVMLNLLLLIVNGLDINFLFIDGKLPKGLSYSEFVHQGTGMLITSIVVAIAVILFYFRGALNFFEKSKAIKVLAYVWIIQNVFMLFSTAMRNEMYINEYGLTHKRIGVYVYLLLATIGLCTTFLKISKAKSNMFLLRSNSWLFYATLIISCFFNWDMVITNFNIQKAGRLDKYYLAQLSNTNLPQLFELRLDSLRKHKEFKMEENEYSRVEAETRNSNNYFDYDKYLNTKLFFFLHNREETGWRSWYYDGQTVNEQLEKMKVYNTIYEIDLGATNLNTIAGLQHFTSLKKLNLYNNQIISLDGIQYLTNLEDLDVSSNSLEDFSPLYSLKNLKYLHVSGISPDQLKTLLAHLPNVKLN